MTAVQPTLIQLVVRLRATVEVLAGRADRGNHATMAADLKRNCDSAINDLEEIERLISNVRCDLQAHVDRL